MTMNRLQSTVAFVSLAVLVLCVESTFGFHVPLPLTPTILHHNHIRQYYQTHHHVKTKRRVNHIRRTSIHLPAAAAALLDGAIAAAALSATAKLLSSIGLGAWAAKQPVGGNSRSSTSTTNTILDPTTVSALSKLIFWMFQPAFLFTSVAKTVMNNVNSNSITTAAGVSGGGQLAVSVMPIVATIQIALGFCTGKLLTSVLYSTNKNTKDIATNAAVAAERRNVLMCMSFANSGPLPLLFTEALFAGTPLQGQVTACISFYLLAWSPLFWIFGRMILNSSSQDSKNATSLLQTVFSPPVLGSLVGYVVGSISWLRNLFLNTNGLLSPVTGALTTLGAAYLPAAILVLAGSLVQGGGSPTAQKESVDTATQSLQPRFSNFPSLKAILSIMVSRFLLAPMMALLLVSIFSKYHLLGTASSSSARSIAVVTYSILMQGCMPPAQNSVVMLQLMGPQHQRRAANMAQLLTVLYTLSVLPVTLLLSACLGRSGIMNYL